MTWLGTESDPPPPSPAQRVDGLMIETRCRFDREKRGKVRDDPFNPVYDRHHESSKDREPGATSRTQSTEWESQRGGEILSEIDSSRREWLFKYLCGTQGYVL